jgi:hypothetical protein
MIAGLTGRDPADGSTAPAGATCATTPAATNNNADATRRISPHRHIIASRNLPSAVAAAFVCVVRGRDRQVPGGNFDGQLDNGTLNNSSTPVPVTNLANVVAITGASRKRAR